MLVEDRKGVDRQDYSKPDEECCSNFILSFRTLYSNHNNDVGFTHVVRVYIELLRSEVRPSYEKLTISTSC